MLSRTILVLSFERNTFMPTCPDCWLSASYKAVKSDAVVDVEIVIGFWFLDSISNVISPFPLKLYSSTLLLADALIPKSDIFSFISFAANFAELPAAIFVVKLSPARLGK